MSSETLFLDDSWGVPDSSSDIPAETEAIRHEINEHRLRDLEDLLLRLDKLERGMQRLHARYQAADQFCLETARRMNAIAFDGLVDLGEVRKLLTTATQSSHVEQVQT
ncbi:hypothetical protein F1559_000182 [Cyanidiococcus yangmingshanensis]|uniref:Uncharacterized protein n=1 Tax=Cyanidiococcus yangmingshanensis TaxID=2690220 RepID=A0A7J7IPT8_9RHOD|nr:hypothetical protein F1559_000182 [Cyanidiococcus yangmingshanensis]